ncbi:MAG: ribbon-helix-helix domain-containing protein [Terriglobales bacterium]
MPAGAVITLRLDAETRQQLDRLSKAQRRSRPSVAAEAIREYVAVNA